MNNNKFERGKIYTIRSHLTDLIYVGSTVEPYLSTRLKSHRKQYKRYKNGYKKYVASFDILEIDENCYIELYEDYPCENKQQLRKREGQVIRELDCCNKYVAGRTPKEWREDNKEHICVRDKQYYINNKEKIKAQRSQKHNCECGGKYTHHNKSIHLKTKKHREYMEFMYG